MASASRAIQNEWLGRVLGIGLAASPTANGGRAAGVRLAQAMIGWNAARTDVGRQIGQLQDAICAAAADHPQYAEVVDGVAALDEVMEQLDDQLGAKLSEIRAVAGEAEKAPLLRDARSLVARLQRFVDGDPLLADLDGDNGFMKLDIKSRLSSSLGGVLAAL